MRTSKRQSKIPRLSVKLQILFVKGNEFTEEFASISEDLVWLRWENFPHRSFPSWLSLRNLSVLELSGANELEELWECNANVRISFLLEELYLQTILYAFFN